MSAIDAIKESEAPFQLLQGVLPVPGIVVLQGCRKGVHILLHVVQVPPQGL